MIQHLSLNNFTKFRQAEVSFIPEVNVIIGVNGSGKSHLMKLAYALSRVSAASKDDAFKLSPDTLRIKLTEELLAVFLPDNVSKLITNQEPSSNIGITFTNPPDDIGITISKGQSYAIALTTNPKNGIANKVIFIPTKEVLSWYKGFLQLYNTKEIAIDKTYADLCEYLSLPPLKGVPKPNSLNALISQRTTELLGGPIKLINEHFSIGLGTNQIDAVLVAEGLLKIGIVGYLATNDVLDTGSILFWDEPEANLNPDLIKQTASIINLLGSHGIQVIIATHSLFLLKELHILSQTNNTAINYISLNKTEGGTEVEITNNLGLLSNIPSLEAELEQSERFVI